MEIYTEVPKKKNKNEEAKPVEKEITIGKATVSLLDAVMYAKNSVYMVFAYDDRGKVRFRIYLQRFSIKQHYTFMDLYTKNSLNIVPIIGVDFSLANLTFDDAQHCIHTMRQGVPNDYVSCMNAVTKAYNYFSRFALSYGFGASTFLKGDHPACPLFSVTGDFLDPFVENNSELNRCYHSTLKAVKLGLPVLFQEILKFVCDLAQAEMDQASADENDGEDSYDIEDEEEKENEQEGNG